MNDFSAYAYWLDEYARKYRVAIHVWVFMTNHIHLLATPESGDGVSRLIQALGRNYVRYFNFIYKRTGTLWEGRFKSCVVDEENYFLICQWYIELNPVRADMVAMPEDYKWSSYQASGLGKTIKLWTPHRVYRQLGSTTTERTHAYREMFRGHLDEKIVHKIRQATYQGMVLGGDRFKEEVKRLSGRRVTPLKRGPKTKQKSVVGFLL